jgi:hypothetical protein
VREGLSTVRPWLESASFPASRARGRSRSRGIGGQESSCAQPRRSEHHRGPMESRECRQNHDKRSRHHDDRGCERRHNIDDDRDRSWSPNQRAPWAFGRTICDAKFPSRFQAPTNVPRYSGDTNPSVWLEDYRLKCHAGGATDDLFVMKNLPLYLGDSARTWLRHLPRDKIHDWIDLRRVFVGNFQGTYMCSGKKWELRNCKQQPMESLREYIRRFSKRCTELPGATTRLTMTPSRHSRMARRARPSSTDSGAACLARPASSSTLRATTPTARRRSPQR